LGQTAGLPPALLCPWLQDAVKKITGDELPDFYNIVLERPKDDPDGYDVLFIDAAAKARMACSTGGGWGDSDGGAKVLCFCVLDYQLKAAVGSAYSQPANTAAVQIP